MKTISEKFLKLIISLGIMTYLGLSSFNVLASKGYMYIPSACDKEWDFVASIPCQVQRENLHPSDIRTAEEGNVSAQLYIALVVSDDDEFRKYWTKKAADNGSLSAAAYYSYLYDQDWENEPFTSELHDQLLKPIIDAANDGDARSATWLMLMSRGDQRHCPLGKRFLKCPVSPLILKEDTIKWSEIAAMGGNMGAAQSLCQWYTTTLDNAGLPREDNKAFFWCQMAAPHRCATQARFALAKLYKQDRVPSTSLYTPQLEEYWEKRSNEDIKSLAFSGRSSCY